jgi:hypothetical protein
VEPRREELHVVRCGRAGSPAPILDEFAPVLKIARLIDDG